MPCKLCTKWDSLLYYVEAQKNHWYRTDSGLLSKCRTNAVSSRVEDLNLGPPIYTISAALTTWPHFLHQILLQPAVQENFNLIDTVVVKYLVVCKCQCDNKIVKFDADKICRDLTEQNKFCQLVCRVPYFFGQTSIRSIVLYLHNW